VAAEYGSVADSGESGEGVCFAASARKGVAVRALDGLSVEIQAGARIGIVGASGSGKSTLALCLACVERPDSGTIRFLNRDLTRLMKVSCGKSGRYNSCFKTRRARSIRNLQPVKCWKSR